MMKWFLFFCLFLSVFEAKSQINCDSINTERFRVLFLLDASYSMEKKWDNTTLWSLAKKTISEFSYYLQRNYDVEMGLRVYGHNSPISANNCEDSKLEVPIGANHAYKIASKLRKIRYQGTTPLTYSLEKAADDLGCKSKNNIIILITDGYETCQRDPCAMVEKLLKYKIAIRPLIIGLNINPEEIKHLECIGDFSNANSKSSFKKSLYRSFQKIVNQKSVSLFLNNGVNSKSETDIEYSLYDSKKDTLIGTYFHTLSSNGLPDTFSINYLDTIAIKLHTIPPLYYHDKRLVNKKHNSIQLDYPVSSLNFEWKNYTKSSTYFPPKVLIYKEGKPVSTSLFDEELKIVKGEYDIYLNTIPMKLFKNFSIGAGQKQKIELMAPGYLTASSDVYSYADLYFHNGKQYEKVYTFNPSRRIEKLTLLPGKYKVIYRSKNAMTIHATFDKEFEIKSNEQVQISM